MVKETVSCRFCGNMNSLIPYSDDVLTDGNYQCRSCGGYTKQGISGRIVGVDPKIKHTPICCDQRMGVVGNDNEDWLECEVCGKTIA